MTPDLEYLVLSAVLTFVQVVIAVLGCMSQVGLPQLAGNRDDVPAQYDGWVGRAIRAHRNMLENLVLFAILVLVAQVTGKASVTTALGAQIFFFGRLAYAAIYIAGIPWLRTAAWAVSVVGMVLILIEVL